jgi:two-component system, OmpR family, sensor histidine kinase KdpD
MTPMSRMSPLGSRWRLLAGAGASLALLGALTGVMIPFRDHLSVATAGLVLVVPVVAGVAIGGLPIGVLAVAAGFLVYDFVFIRPYYTLSVGVGQNWLALVVYAAVMLGVAAVVALLDRARAEAQRRGAGVQRVFELSELLVEDRPLAELLERVVRVVQQAFDTSGVALLLPASDELQVVASEGIHPDDAEVSRLAPTAGAPVHVGTVAGGREQTRAIALSASGRPVGILLLRGLPASSADRELLATFANHAAVAIERAQLKEQALRAEVFEAADKVRRGLVGAVSHDLRTPLATIKVATTDLLDQPSGFSSPADARELLELVDMQADRLDRLVANLLDMTRVQSGALVAHPEPVLLVDLITEAVRSLGSSVPAGRVGVRFHKGLPMVDADPVLVRQVLANLVENALRHGPDDTPVTVSATTCGGVVEVAVTDQGPGVPSNDRPDIFEMFNRRDAGGRAGLGLAIVKAFVEAHGQRIWVEDGCAGGARFVFTLPASPLPAEQS